jgi:hypothetical protein
MGTAARSSICNVYNELSYSKGDLQDDPPVGKADGPHRAICQLTIVGNHEDRLSTRYQILKELDDLG